MHAVFCSRLQSNDNSDSIDCHFCISAGHFVANFRKETVKTLVEQYIMIAENWSATLKEHKFQIILQLCYKPNKSNGLTPVIILQSIVKVWHAWIITTTKAQAVRMLFHLNFRSDSDGLVTPITGNTPKNWPIISKGQMAFRKVPSKHLFSPEIDFKSIFSTKFQIFNVRTMSTDFNYYELAVSRWTLVMIVYWENLGAGEKMWFELSFMLIQLEICLKWNNILKLAHFPGI